MPAEMNKRTIGQARLGGIAAGAIDVVGAEDVRYEAEPGRGGPDDGGGTKEGGSESMALSRSGMLSLAPTSIGEICR
jgi:hypothetical protein